MYSQIADNKRRTWLLIAIVGAFITSLGVILNQGLGYGYESIAGAIILSIVLSLGGYFRGDKVALWSSGAKEIQSADNPYLFRLVENLTIATGLPMPRVYIIPSPALNAFATGRDPKHASIAVTSGLLERLENEELEGVLAHELSHIQNYDIRVMTLVVVLVGALALIADFSFRVRPRSSDRDRSAGGILMIVGVVLLILSPIIGEMIKLAISRRREYLADASGALMTRYPEGLARALEKISQNEIPLQTANQATAHLFIANPFKAKGARSFFSTHPPVEDRIKKLREMT